MPGQETQEENKNKTIDNKIEDTRPHTHAHT